jgi:excisionase family DNA binding protein
MNSYQTSGTSPTNATILSTQGTFEPLLDDKQVGELLGLHSKTVQRLARDGEIPSIRIGRKWRYRATALEAWLALQSSGQSTRVN